MFVPIHDDTPLKVIRFQTVTIMIILLNVVVFLLTGAFTSERVALAYATGFGIVPAEFLGGISYQPAYDIIPEPLCLLTYMFLHGGWLHLITNMLFLWVFADNVEDAFGHVAFAMFYLVCGVAAGLTHIIIEPSSHAPLVGASGAVSGVLGAYLLLYPRARVWILLFMRLPLRLGAAWVLGGWFIVQIVSLLYPGNDGIEVAWFAHIGGFLTGLAITFMLRSRLLIRTGD